MFCDVIATKVQLGERIVLSQCITERLYTPIADFIPIQPQRAKSLVSFEAESKSSGPVVVDAISPRDNPVSD